MNDTLVSKGMHYVSFWNTKTLPKYYSTVDSTNTENKSALAAFMINILNIWLQDVMNFVRETILNVYYIILC